MFVRGDFDNASMMRPTHARDWLIRQSSVLLWTQNYFRLIFRISNRLVIYHLRQSGDKLQDS